MSQADNETVARTQCKAEESSAKIAARVMVGISGELNAEIDRRLANLTLSGRPTTKKQWVEAAIIAHLIATETDTH